MIPYYEELNDEEKNAVTKVIRTLLKQTFVLERKYDKKSGRLVYNKEFRTIDLHQEFLREYFKISGIELRENLHLGVFYIEGETLIGEKISRLSTIYLLILKLLYDEHMAEASSNTSVYTSLGEIHEKINDFHLMRTLPSITEMRRSIALLKKYQIIEPLDVLEELNSNAIERMENEKRFCGADAVRSARYGADSAARMVSAVVMPSMAADMIPPA